MVGLGIGLGLRRWGSENPSFCVRVTSIFYDNILCQNYMNRNHTHMHALCGDGEEDRRWQGNKILSSFKFNPVVFTIRKMNK